MSEDQFEFTEAYQAKIISYMLHDPQFCGRVRDVVSPEQFGNKQLQWYFDRVTEKPHSPITLQEELVAAAKGNVLKEGEVPKYVSLFEHISTPPTKGEQDHILTSVDSFCKTQDMKRALLGSFDMIKEERWEEITQKVSKVLRSGIGVDDLGMRYVSDLDDRMVRMTSREHYKYSPTGVPDLDEFLCRGKGMKNKQLGMVAGGTGRGKSIFLQYVARSALMRGQKVLYLTLEMSADDIASRFDSMFSRIHFGGLREDPIKTRDTLTDVFKTIGDNLVIKEYPAVSITVEGVTAFIERLRATGFFPDVVIVDYLDLLRPSARYNAEHAELDSITKELHGMCKSLNILVWTASQLNRAGITQETPDETAIAGALAKLYTVDFAVFLAQTKEQREGSLMRLAIVKNRNGPVARPIEVTTDYAFMTFLRDASLGESLVEADLQPE